MTGAGGSSSWSSSAMKEILCGAISSTSAGRGLLWLSGLVGCWGFWVWWFISWEICLCTRLFWGLECTWKSRASDWCEYKSVGKRGKLFLLFEILEIFFFEKFWKFFLIAIFYGNPWKSVSFRNIKRLENPNGNHFWKWKRIPSWKFCSNFLRFPYF